MTPTPIPAASSLPDPEARRASPAGSPPLSAGRPSRSGHGPLVTRAMLLDAQARGIGGSQLARELKVAPSVVTRAKQREGILLEDKRVERMRRRDWNTATVMTPKRVAAARAALAEGLGWQGVADRIGVEASTVKAWGYRHGIRLSRSRADEEWLALRDRRVTARIAAHLAGSSLWAAHKAAQRLGFRWRQAPHVFGRRPLSPLYDTLAELRAQGLTYAQIGERLGRAPHTIYRAAARRGLTNPYSQRGRS
jgi:hypothetical protein